MNVFASCWKVSPEDIWNAALENKIEDARGQSVFSRGDALSAKEQALSQIKKYTPASQIGEINTTSAHIPAMTNLKPQSAAPVNPNIKRIRELEESIAVLKREEESIGGLFGFIKKNRIRKEIEAQQRQLEALKRR